MPLIYQCFCVILPIQITSNLDCDTGGGNGQCFPFIWLLHRRIKKFSSNKDRTFVKSKSFRLKPHNTHTHTHSHEDYKHYDDNFSTFYPFYSSQFMQTFFLYQLMGVSSVCKVRRYRNIANIYKDWTIFNILFVISPYFVMASSGKKCGWIETKWLWFIFHSIVLFVWSSLTQPSISRIMPHLNCEWWPWLTVKHNRNRIIYHKIWIYFKGAARIIINLCIWFVWEAQFG